MTEIQEKIKNVRELKNLTQEYVAEKLGITQAAYSKIESGTTKVSYEKLFQISNILGIEMNELLNFDSQKFFNNLNNVKGNNNGITLDTTQENIETLYQDKIKLLEKVILLTERELKAYKDKFGEI